jgi:hypothetical protein
MLQQFAVPVPVWTTVSVADRTAFRNAGAVFPNGASWTTVYTGGSRNLLPGDRVGQRQRRQRHRPQPHGGRPGPVVVELRLVLVRHQADRAQRLDRQAVGQHGPLAGRPGWRGDRGPDAGQAA